MMSQVPRDILVLIGGYMTLAPDIRTFKLISKRFNMISYDAITHLCLEIKPICPSTDKDNMHVGMVREGHRLREIKTITKRLPPLPWIAKHRFLEVIAYPFCGYAVTEWQHVLEKLSRLRHLFMTHVKYPIDMNIFTQWPQLKSLSFSSRNPCHWDVSGQEIFVSEIRGIVDAQLVMQCQQLYSAKRLVINHFDAHDMESVEVINGLGLTEIYLGTYCCQSLYNKLDNVKVFGIGGKGPVISLGGGE